MRRTAHWSPTTRGLLWVSSSGLIFSMLNAVMRGLTQQVDPFQAQFLRYFVGLLVLLPVVLPAGWAAYRPKDVTAQFTRGAVHTLGLGLWFMALPRIPLADMTAIGFTGPIFIMIGAWLVFHEPMRWERWLATLLGFGGVLIIVGPKLSGSGGVWHLVMLASAPVFAASFLLTKAMTRHESAGVILVWQSISVSVISLPLALWHWQSLSLVQWGLFGLCGVLGSAGHYCLTRGFAAADISATQSARFLDLVWSAVMGWLLFADLPSAATLLGGSVISAATVWLARRESLRRQGAAT
ncbi:DMT family transporter [Aquabacterium sp. OR-4]|uniref:DMT family transporter n=1 Tax=Aquabacterium sp. OR-4 TaxID=2978127 RepID=UPI0028C6236E|nr:DMT family transporter [Aquabacterium sp. OR-4]MDT7838472.1 DMT family transporter [Aquabacterium sp. OR-4]